MWEWHKVGDCLILLSSGKVDRVRLVYNKWGRPLLIHDRANYHLVFDNGIGLNLCTRICHVLAGLGILERDYMKIREFRGDMTLRVSPAYLSESSKPMPRVADLIYNNFTNRSDGWISYYLRIKKSVESLFSLKHEAKAQTHKARDSPND